MKILIYLTGGTHWLGGVQYTRNLLCALSQLPDAEQPQIVLQVGRKNRGTGLEDEFARYSNVEIDGPRDDGVSLWLRTLSVLRKIRRRLDGRDTPGAILRSDDCAVAFPAKGPNIPGPSRKVYWVPDFQYKHYPEYFSDQERDERNLMYERMFNEHGILVFSSEAVHADFRRFFPRFAGKPVRILRFASSIESVDYEADPIDVCKQLGLPEKFVYLPNQMWQHKGFDTAFLALGKLQRKGVGIQLVCTGKAEDYRNSAYDKTLQKMIAEQGLSDQIHMLGVLPRATQLQLYRRAAFILQPSRFEGWSTSVEDARALGRPILLSDIDVHREQNPAFGHYFTVGDESDLADRLEYLWRQIDAGPDKGREELAREDGVCRNLQFARTFMTIMKEAAQY